MRVCVHQDASLDGKDPIIWYSFGVTHVVSGHTQLAGQAEETCYWNGSMP